MLQYNKIGDEDIQEIINGLRQNTTLTILDLQNNNMNEDTIIEFLKNNPPNRQLLINQNIDVERLKEFNYKY